MPTGDGARPVAERDAGTMTGTQSGIPDAGTLGPVALLGLGLIGGSIARALRTTEQPPRVVAWTPSGAGPRAALADGTIDRAAGSVADAVEGAAIVVLAGPPLAILELLGSEMAALRSAVEDGATLTDVASTKARIVAAADEAGLPFVGGHPMAGAETSGFEAADEALFRSRPWVLVPGAVARDVDVTRVEGVVRGVGARPIRLTADEHDAAVAAISHLPLVASAALVEAVATASDWPGPGLLAASGWAGMTRLTRGDPEMGAGILATNAEATLERLRAYRTAIDAWIEALADGDAGVLRGRLAAARAALEEDVDA